ncbi:MAG: glutamate cyclase domain-containing protein [Clostridium fessum]
MGDGGNEMGMGTFRREILAGVPHGELICTAEAADLTLASGVSNWWGWGIASLLSLELGRNLLPLTAPRQNCSAGLWQQAVWMDARKSGTDR